MKKLALAALLAATASAAPAAVTIKFTGVTDPSGLYTTTVTGGTADSVYEADPVTVQGTLVIQTNVIAGTNQATEPAAYYGGVSFLSGSFTSTGLTPTILTSGTADHSVDADPDSPYAQITFSYFQGGASPDDVHQYSTIYLFTNSPVQMKYYGGVLLPDFSTATGLAFSVADFDGTVTDNVQHFSSGTVSSVTVSVPEPASWAMMVGGFGLVGGAMRRRREIATAA